MLAEADPIAFIPITEVGRARAFYESTLGLSVREESPFALVIDAHGVMLRLTPVENLRPQPFTIAGWAVDDIAAVARELSARGVAFNRYEGMEQDADGVWDSPSGARVAWFADPDGNTLSLTEFSQEEASSPR